MWTGVDWHVLSALRLLGVDLVLSLQSEQHRLIAATRHAFLRQVLEGALSRPLPPPERLLQSLLVQVRVEAGVLLDGGHAGAVQRGVTGVGAGCRVGAGGRRGAGLLGAGQLETQPSRGGGGGEGWRFEDPKRCRIQAAQELGILGKINTQLVYFTIKGADRSFLTSLAGAFLQRRVSDFGVFSSLVKSERAGG